MARMVDLIREGSAPASILRRAAQGGLSLPAHEAIEILVALIGDRELGGMRSRRWTDGMKHHSSRPPRINLHQFKYSFICFSARHTAPP